MEAERDKEGPCAPPVFTKKVIPEKETLKNFLESTGLHLVDRRTIHSLGRD